MTKEWQNNKEPKKQAVLTPKEKKAIKAAKKNGPTSSPLLTK
jgi:hypothetical protein